MVTLNLDRVNAVSPYQLIPSEYPLFYNFITDYGIDYNVGFTPSDLMPDYESYEFIITNPNHRKSPRDYKLRDSILTLLYEFFRNREAVMLYLCETGDKRQEHRNRLFASWYQHATKHHKYFALLNAVIPDEEGVWNYVALILRPDHPQFVKIAQEFNETVELFRDKPE